MWVETFFRRLASIPVRALKSAFNKEILLLSLGRIELGFFGLDPKTMSDVLWESDGLFPECTACITSVNASPKVSQQRL